MIIDSAAGCKEAATTPDDESGAGWLVDGPGEACRARFLRTRCGRAVEPMDDMGQV